MRKTKIIFFTLTCLSLFGLAESSEAVYSLPADRVITWQGNIGVSGGIPARTTEVNCTQAPYNVPTDGTTAAQTAINNCLNGIAAEQTAYLPAGTYLITGAINLQNNKTLRGAGMTQTVIRANSNFGNSFGCGLICASGGYTTRSTATVVDITSMTKGNAGIVVSDSSAFSIGDYLFIDVLNGTWLNNSVPEDCGVFGGGRTRCFNSLHKVTGKSGNTLTINPSVIHPSYQSDTPQAVKVSHSMRIRAGLENLTVKNDTGVTSATANNNVFFQGTSESWIKNTKIERCGRYCLYTFFDNYKPEIRDNWVEGCVDRVPSDRCYGVAYSHTWFGLIENNVFKSTAEATLVNNSSGNVIAYNYGYDTNRVDPSSPGWFWGGDWHHMLHSSYNLFEGEDMEGLMLDNIHGSSSHNTIFKSRLRSKKSNNICCGTTCNFSYAVALGRYQRWINVIGNVLGTDGYNTKYDEATFNTGDYNIYSTGYDSAGGAQDVEVFNTLLRHANYDYVTDSQKLCNGSGEPGCQGGSSDTSLPNSLYLSSKPSWFGSLPWPPVDPATATATDIPAKVYYETGSWPTAGGDTTAPSAPQGLSVQ